MKFKYLKNPPKSTWANSIEETPEEYIGFVYEIYDKLTKKKYIGIKKLWQPYNLAPLKGNKNKRKFLKESDWRTYNSSGVMKEEIEKNPERFVKTIIRYCKTVTEMKAKEAYIQLDYYFNGRWEELYNEMINLRLRIPKKRD